MKSVYVTSQDPEINPEKSASSKPLPLNRQTVEMFEFGYNEPKNVPIGKVTLRTALKFITDHQADPIKCSIKKIADKHLLPEEKVGKCGSFRYFFASFISSTCFIL